MSLMRPNPGGESRKGNPLFGGYTETNICGMVYIKVNKITFAGRIWG